MLLVFYLCFLFGLANTELFSDESNALLPRVYHLDDYSRCLAPADGLYCEGEFTLAPLAGTPQYKQMLDYSSNPFTFNRSRLHRGYCVSSRCPSAEPNATLRFERCVAKYARSRQLSARLRTASCTSRREREERAKRVPDEAQQLFLRVVYAILLLNFVGTAYDLLTGDNAKKNDLLTSWSIRTSWQKLLARYDDGDPRLKNLGPAQGLRVMVLLVAIYAHANFFHFQYHVTNPNFLEHLSYRVDGMILANGTSIIQMFVLLSAFLTAYNILRVSHKFQLRLHMLPLLIVKRFIRIAPVYLLVVGYAATWWPYAREGPLMTSVVAPESDICRRKFWYHVFFVNNMVDPQNICMQPTWFLPVDMHLHILSCALTIFMVYRRQHAIRLYAWLFGISSILSAVIVYANGWRSMVYFAKPDILRGFFRSEESYWMFYTSSWGSLPSCFMGLLLAHLHFELEEKTIDYSKVQWITHYFKWSVPIAVIWPLVIASHVRDIENKFVVGLYSGLDRPCVSFFMFVVMFGLFNVKGPIRRFLGWSGWRVIARLSLPIMLSHWCINAVISARPHAFETSVFSILMDYSATLTLTLISSLLISLFVEIPVQKFMSKILF